MNSTSDKRVFEPETGAYTVLDYETHIVELKGALATIKCLDPERELEEFVWVVGQIQSLGDQMIEDYYRMFETYSKVPRKRLA